jgi:hypothetical protein
LRTINGFELLKYAHAKYKGIANFKLGFPYKLSKNYNEGEPKLISPMDSAIDLKVFSCSTSCAIEIKSDSIDSLLVPANVSPIARAEASPITDVLEFSISFSLSPTV